MSAECYDCGSDLVYAGEWPGMECPVCTVKAERDRYKAALEHIAAQGAGTYQTIGDTYALVDALGERWVHWAERAAAALNQERQPGGDR